MSQSPQQEDLSGPPAANRHRLPDERVGLTHHLARSGLALKTFHYTSLVRRRSAALAESASLQVLG
jgi:hypothetical protein